MTLLSLVQNAANELGIGQVTEVASQLSAQSRQMFALANRTGKNLAKRTAWQALITEASWTSTATEQQPAGSVPSDLAWPLNNTVWNRSDIEQMFGPLSPATWQRLKASNVNSPFNRFRMKGGRIHLLPAPSAGETLVYEYVTKNWCQDASSTAQEAFQADTDTSLLDEELITLGIIWRYRQAKGFDYAESFRDYEIQVTNASARDGFKPTISMAGPVAYSPQANVPDGSWNL